MITEEISGVEDDVMLSNTYIEYVASRCHVTNLLFCRTLGDYSQPEWEDAPEWVKESAINGVKFSLSHPESSSEDQHNNWMKDKVADGWIYGEVKDPEKKTHPCMLPYKELPIEQQFKDYLFRLSIAAGLMELIGGGQDALNE